MKSRRLETQLIHAGEPRPRIDGAVSLPIFQTSTFELEGDALRYLRLNNTPNHDALHSKLAALEGAQAALVAASGMAAISMTLLSLLGPGDHVLVQRGIYGGTYDLLTVDLERLGIECTFIDGRDPSSWDAAVRPETRAVYAESLTNPLLEMSALPELAAFAEQGGLVSIVDNTFATPVNFRPIEHGFDLVVHSATKYLNGHSDLVAGVVAGRAELVASIKTKLDHFGGTLDPHACFLLHRGLKTLAVRMRQHNETALTLAQYLASRPEVADVRYPGLPSHPDHGRAKELLAGFGGMLSFEVQGGVSAATKVVEALELAVDAPSLGGPETLVTRPALTSHRGMGPEGRASIGIAEGLVRVSTGLESVDDLIEDFERALRRLG